MVNIMASLNDRICVAAQLHITALTLSCPESASHQSISTVDSRYAFCTTLIETQSHTDLVHLLIDWFSGIQAVTPDASWVWTLLKNAECQNLTICIDENLVQNKIAPCWVLASNQNCAAFSEDEAVHHNKTKFVREQMVYRNWRQQKEHVHKQQLRIITLSVTPTHQNSTLTCPYCVNHMSFCKFE